MANKNNNIKDSMKRVGGKMVDWLIDQIAKSENYIAAEARVNIDFTNKILKNNK